MTILMPMSTGRRLPPQEFAPSQDAVPSEVASVGAGRRYVQAGRAGRFITAVVDPFDPVTGPHPSTNGCASEAPANPPASRSFAEATPLATAVQRLLELPAARTHTA